MLHDARRKHDFGNDQLNHIIDGSLCSFHGATHEDDRVNKKNGSHQKAHLPLKHRAGDVSCKIDSADTTSTVMICPHPARPTYENRAVTGRGLAPEEEKREAVFATEEGRSSRTAQTMGKRVKPQQERLLASAGKISGVSLAYQLCTAYCAECSVTTLRKRAPMPCIERSQSWGASPARV